MTVAMDMAEAVAYKLSNNQEGYLFKQSIEIKFKNYRSNLNKKQNNGIYNTFPLCIVFNCLKK